MPAPLGVIGSRFAPAKLRPCFLDWLGLAGSSHAPVGRSSIAAVLLIAAVPLLGCGGTSSAPDSRSVGAGLVGEPSLPRGTDAGRVERVVDGDTVVLAGLGSSRLIGVDTPEVHGGVECYGREASSFAHRLLPPGRTVRYVIGTQPRDRYGRLLVYLWLEDGRSFNGMLVESGHAAALTVPPNVEYAGRFRRLARDARRQERGLWSETTCHGPG